VVQRCVPGAAGSQLFPVLNPLDARRNPPPSFALPPLPLFPPPTQPFYSAGGDSDLYIYLPWRNRSTASTRSKLRRSGGLEQGESPCEDRMRKYARVAFSAGPQRCDDGVWSRQKDEWAQHLYSHIIETGVHCGAAGRGDHWCFSAAAASARAARREARFVRRFWVCLFCPLCTTQLAMPPLRL